MGTVSGRTALNLISCAASSGNFRLGQFNKSIFAPAQALRRASSCAAISSLFLKTSYGLSSTRLTRFHLRPANTMADPNRRELDVYTAQVMSGRIPMTMPEFTQDPMRLPHMYDQ